MHEHPRQKKCRSEEIFLTQGLIAQMNARFKEEADKFHSLIYIGPLIFSLVNFHSSIRACLSSTL